MYSKIYDLALLELPPGSVEEEGTNDPQGLPMCKSWLVNESVYFLGFPLGLHIEVPKLKGAELYAFPFVKHAILSGSIQVDSSHTVLVLDGINNPGFSGGPVIIKDNNKFNFCVCGMVTGYVSVAEKVLDSKQVDTGHTIQSNTGLILAVPNGAFSDLIAGITAPIKQQH